MKVVALCTSIGYVIIELCTLTGLCEGSSLMYIYRVCRVCNNRAMHTIVFKIKLGIPNLVYYYWIKFTENSQY